MPRPAPPPVSRPEPSRPTYTTPSRPSYQPSSRDTYTAPARETPRSSGNESSARTDSGRSREDSGRQAANPTSRVYDSARSTADQGSSRSPSSRYYTSTGSRESGERSSRGSGEVDLSTFGGQRRSGVPSLSTSMDERRSPQGRYEAAATHPPVRAQPLTRENLLDRYRPPHSGLADVARAREHSDKGLSRLRGASSAGLGSTPSGKRGREDRAVTNELRKQQYEHASERFERLDRKDPALARQVMRTGESLAVATDLSLRIAIGASFATCGGGSGFAWWDPYNHGYGSPYNTWWNHCGPCSWWWWNNSCNFWPNWGWGWSWGAGWSTWNCGWNTHPYWNYPGYHYFGCSPWWYSNVIYVDSYDPPPQVIVVHESDAQPAPLAQPAGEAEVAGGNLPPQKRDPALAQALVRSAQQYVALGDLAFSERRFGDAVAHYAKAIEYAPDDAVLYMLLSDALFATGDYHYSATALRKALELEPRLVDTIVDKHAVYTDPQDFEKQLGYLENYLKDNFLDEDARLVLAANYLFGNKPHQALDLLQSSFSLEVRQSSTGTLLFDRARQLATDNPFSK
ncbi:MAG: hypothetical protein IPJ19_19710 [Planctomycetes bacterium]|nr:hypothetical protein [Planctomycetota bacterium]